MPVDATIQEWVRPNERLLRARESMGWSQEEFAMRSGVSRSIIGLVERLGYKPGAILQERIATTLHLTVLDIWPDVQEQ